MQNSDFLGLINLFQIQLDYSIRNEALLVTASYYKDRTLPLKIKGEGTSAQSAIFNMFSNDDEPLACIDLVNAIKTNTNVWNEYVYGNMQIDRNGNYIGNTRWHRSKTAH